MVTRLGTAVAPGGTLFLVGHLPVDPATGEPTPAAGQVQVTVEDAVEALDSREWNIVLAEERTRAGDTGVDAVVRGIYRPSRHSVKRLLTLPRRTLGERSRRARS